MVEVSEADRRHALVMRRAVGDDAAQQHARRAEQQEARQADIGDLTR